MDMEMYLNVAGVAGGSQDIAHRNWIDVLSFHWGAAQGATERADAGRVRFYDLRVRARLDRASPALMMYCARGMPVEHVVLSMYAMQGRRVERTRLVLDDVRVSRMEVHGDKHHDGVIVTYGFRATAVRNHYWALTPQGGKGAESMTGWDRRKNIAC
ncbi:Hcp family type VI secretion system effector [Serratia bockelmannii]|uniref:Hcp family type VI secretion system effector n=1 Tax=Serratia TaxID=613 RepID=UPI00235FE926|nr:type VI secretion system tube protein Hcp [Serratia bockelmannii]